MYYKKIYKKVFTLFVFLFACQVSAKDIHYAGFFLMSHQDVKKELPYSYEALYSSPVRYKKFSQFIENEIENTTNPNYTISMDLGTIKKGDALAFGIAISGESINYFAAAKSAQYELTFNVLVFDFKDKLLISKIPFRWRFAKDSPEKPSNEKVLNDIYSSLFKKPTPTEKNLNPLSFAKVLRDNISAIPENFQLMRVGINSVVIHPDVELPGNLTPEIFGIQSAQRFESKISEHIGIPLIPYSIGSIKDRKLGLLSKFSDQADFFLKLPEPDLAFNLTIKRFKSAQENYDEYRIWKKIVAKAYIELVEPYTDESYFSGNIYILRKFKLSKDNIGDYSGVNLWSAYQNLQNYLFHSFSKQIKSPDSDKLREISKDIDVSMMKSLLSEIKQ